MSHASRLDAALDQVDPIGSTGRVRALLGLAIRATAPGARVGDIVVIHGRDRAIRAEVVGFDGDELVLLPFGDAHGVGPGDAVQPLSRGHRIRVGPALLGRAVDGLGEPIDDRGPIDGALASIDRDAPPALSRPPIQGLIETGIRAIDGFLSIGEGQRIGLFAGSGVGKSTLLGQLARQARADVIVVCLVGERGREVRELIEDSLGDALSRSVIVVATSDSPALIRMRSATVATTIAESFRDNGKRVLLLMDSVTRFARAAREVGLAAGEPPARRGYPPSVFALLPRLLERTGTAARGSITAIYTVLVEGGDLDEPVADEVRGLLDGHIVLSRALATRGRWPAIDVLASISRVMPRIVSNEHRRLAESVRAHLGVYETKRDLVLLGAYARGSDPALDAAIAREPQMEAFLAQRSNEPTTLTETLAALAKLA